MKDNNIVGHTWMIYGANGFTGQLIAREAARRGWSPILAGRNRAAVEALATELSLPSKVFPIESAAQAAGQLEGCELVLNCAGPFAATGLPLVEACAEHGIHYLDICGEPDLFEQYYARDAQARASGAVIVPGVGFDVVPSDTLARSLADRLPDATWLEMAFYGAGGGSAGSQKTVMGMLADKCKVRRDGRIKRVALARWGKTVQFSDREEYCISIPWGDVSSAYRSTGIPNFTMYMAMPQKAGRVMRAMSPLAPVLGLPALQKRMFEKIDASVAPPTDEQRAAGYMRLWGRAWNDAGKSVEATMETLEGFTFTTQASLLCVEKALCGGIDGGCMTPTMAFGPRIALEVEGTRLMPSDEPVAEAC
ncbi:hypothetical protein E4634_01010 [Mangrovimicrobium sediminis]|uniref:Saccharopine dehydrogenase NADP binding domain-containing protein n=1 Tax=Mangrovimicrobium sediminis TaxID=2562682 RepID=A0A4Z0M9U3_9GAMM|nr:saccharopine dehydrogenase NADP-binding domain-containing protein [Haliea sp. SAOS-164]TGD76157.1 hypothetical protein E4634_01010 [Haliea sp. SAOS-164]